MLSAELSKSLSKTLLLRSALTNRSCLSAAGSAANCVGGGKQWLVSAYSCRQSGLSVSRRHDALSVVRVSRQMGHHGRSLTSRKQPPNLLLLWLLLCTMFGSTGSRMSQLRPPLAFQPCVNTYLHIYHRCQQQSHADQGYPANPAAVWLPLWISEEGGLAPPYAGRKLCG